MKPEENVTEVKEPAKVTAHAVSEPESEGNWVLATMEEVAGKGRAALDFPSPVLDSIADDEVYLVVGGFRTLGACGSSRRIHKTLPAFVVSCLSH